MARPAPMAPRCCSALRNFAAIHSDEGTLRGGRRVVDRPVASSYTYTSGAGPSPGWRTLSTAASLQAPAAAHGADAPQDNAAAGRVPHTRAGSAVASSQLHILGACSNICAHAWVCITWFAGPFGAPRPRAVGVEDHLGKRRVGPADALSTRPPYAWRCERLPLVSSDYRPQFVMLHLRAGLMSPATLRTTLPTTSRPISRITLHAARSCAIGCDSGSGTC